MDIVTLLVVGLVAGVIASLIVGGTGYGILGSIAVGIGGAFLGAFIFSRAGWQSPVSGLGGTILIATIGAAILLVILHVLTSARARA
ncbi:MAG: GlsB/YeaQ/YmgE family stress response membrane protein [Deltaproteobacteria bacterium]|nr:GlsB/YeaQ/YmgE family stress response membrane protein [Deltaproteobacteria bacterium]